MGPEIYTESVIKIKTPRGRIIKPGGVLNSYRRFARTGSLGISLKSNCEAACHVTCVGSVAYGETVETLKTDRKNHRHFDSLKVH